MEQKIENLGVVSIHPEGDHSSQKEYTRLSLVNNTNNNCSYIAITNVPIGISIDDTAYWQPIAANINQASNLKLYILNGLNNLTNVSNIDDISEVFGTSVIEDIKDKCENAIVVDNYNSKYIPINIYIENRTTIISCIIKDVLNIFKFNSNNEYYSNVVINKITISDLFNVNNIVHNLGTSPTAVISQLGINNIIKNLNIPSSTGIEEAPKDNNVYGRKNGAWSLLNLDIPSVEGKDNLYKTTLDIRNLSGSLTLEQQLEIGNIIDYINNDYIVIYIDNNNQYGEIIFINSRTEGGVDNKKYFLSGISTKGILYKAETTYSSDIWGEGETYGEWNVSKIDLTSNTGGGISDVSSEDSVCLRKRGQWIPTNRVYITDFFDKSNGANAGEYEEVFSEFNMIKAYLAEGSKVYSYFNSFGSISLDVDIRSSESDVNEFYVIGTFIGDNNMEYNKDSKLYTVITKLNIINHEHSTKYSIIKLSNDFIKDSLKNNKTYGRKNGEWVEINNFIDAPSDDKKYARQNNKWVDISNGLTDLGVINDYINEFNDIITPGIYTFNTPNYYGIGILIVNSSYGYLQQILQFYNVDEGNINFNISDIMTYKNLIYATRYHNEEGWSNWNKDNSIWLNTIMNINSDFDNITESGDYKFILNNYYGIGKLVVRHDNNTIIQELCYTGSIDISKTEVSVYAYRYRDSSMEWSKWKKTSDELIESDTLYPITIPQGETIINLGEVNFNPISSPESIFFDMVTKPGLYRFTTPYYYSNGLLLAQETAYSEGDVVSKSLTYSLWITLTTSDGSEPNYVLYAVSKNRVDWVKAKQNFTTW